MPLTSTPIVFLDTETLGLKAGKHPVWEVAALRREPSGLETSYHAFVQHDPSAMDPGLPKEFQDDYHFRYDQSEALSAGQLADWLDNVFVAEAQTSSTATPQSKKVSMLGMFPSFDAQRLELILDQVSATPPWHYHTIDLEPYVAGYLLGRASLSIGGVDVSAAAIPYYSNSLTRAIGLDPDDYPRHSAFGDCLWARDVYDVLHGNPVRPSDPGLVPPSSRSAFSASRPSYLR